jgi:hypothetical protein
MAVTLAGLARSSYEKITGSGTRVAKIGNACCWALGHMPTREGGAQLQSLITEIEDHNAQKVIEKALKAAAKRYHPT